MNGRAKAMGLSLSIAALAGGVAPASSDPSIEYPIVFETRADLEQFGISVGLVYGFTPPKPTFLNACYSYNDEGGYWFSVSDEFLAHYKAKGFTRESLCLALVSFPYFDPETGERMPTFAVLEDVETRQSAIDLLDAEMLLKEKGWLVSDGIFKSKEALAEGVAAAKRGDLKSLTYDQIVQLGLASAQAPTNELPLAVPACFKNGTPFLDCDWRYSMTTGKKLSKATRLRQREFGRALDRLMQDTLKTKSFSNSKKNPDGYLLNDGDIATVPGADDKQEPIFLTRIPSELWDTTQEPMTFIDVSPAFPRGYGHALHSTGEKDDEISIGALPGGLSKRKKWSRYGATRVRGVILAR